MTETVKVLDKEFEICLTEEQIINRIKEVAHQIRNDLKGEDVIFLGILNGSFMFASDLMKDMDLDCQITFLKLASYSGTKSQGTVKRLIGINENIEDKTVVIVEDIIDTGNTLENIKKQLKGYEPKKILTATLLHKPEVYDKDIPIEYVGFNVENKFVIGYGLDYDGFGRNLRHLYQAK